MSSPALSQPRPSLLSQAFSSCRNGFVAVLVFSLCINVLMLTAPLYMMQVFDRVLSSRSGDTLVLLLLIATLALGVMGALDAVRTFLMNRMGAWMDGHLSGAVLGEAVMGYLRRGGSPTVQGLRDLSTVRSFLTGAGVFPILDAPWAPIFIVVIFMLNPWLGVLSLVGAIALFALALANELVTREALKRAGGAAQAAMSDAETAVRNADVVEAMGMMPAMLARWHKKNAEAIALQSVAGDKGGGISAVSKFLRLLLQIAVLTLGAWLVLRGELTSGGMIAGSILMARALAPVEQAIATWKTAVAARQAYDRLVLHLAAADNRAEGMPLPVPKGHLSGEGVLFAFPGQRDPLLRNINFALSPGESLGLIGPTASGKTTLARMIVGNLVPRAGCIRLDGMDVTQWDRADLGRHIGYLPQDIELFAGTVRENIARMGEGDPEAVVRAAQLAGVHQMVLGMAKGYDTEVGPSGAALSGGQRQRVGLARALYGNPRLVVLDEPNANLDSEGEVALMRALGFLKKAGVTTVVIAHRPAIVQGVDKLLALKDGAVMMFGPREEVLAKLRANQEQAQAAVQARAEAQAKAKDGGGAS